MIPHVNEVLHLNYIWHLINGYPYVGYIFVVSTEYNICVGYNVSMVFTASMTSGYNRKSLRYIARWRHDMDILSASLALCEENPPVTKQIAYAKINICIECRAWFWRKQSLEQTVDLPVTWDVNIGCQVYCCFSHCGRWSLPSVCPVTIRTVILTTFPFLWWLQLTFYLNG